VPIPIYEGVISSALFMYENDNYEFSADGESQYKLPIPDSQKDRAQPSLHQEFS